MCSYPSAGHAINPVQSAKLTTVGRFNVKYGRVEVEAKLPKGDWLWPAIWLLPEVSTNGLEKNYDTCMRTVFAV